MPINYLTAIHHKSTIPYLRFEPEVDYAAMVEGIYVFENLSATKGIPLFNDGYSSLIIMPSQQHNSNVSYQNQSTEVHALWVCGTLQEQALWNNPQGLEQMLVVRFFPHVLPSLFPMHVQQLKEQPILNFEQLLDPKIYMEFTALYYKKTRLQDQLQALQGLLRKIYKPVESLPPLLVERISLYKEETAYLGRNASPKEAPVNYKWWQRNFKKYMGMGPKRFAEAQRLLYAYALMDANSSLNLMEIALQCGYYDANHLIKDFKKQIGYSPKFFFNR